MNAPVLIAVVLLLSGCGANMVTTRESNNSRFAPVNDRQGGTVRYITNGFTSKASGRKSAYKKAHNECNGDYQIVREYESKEYANHYWKSISSALT